MSSLRAVELTMIGARDNLSSVVPTADEMMEQIALAEAEKASVAMRRQAALDAEKYALKDHPKGRSAVPEEEAIKKVAAIIQDALRKGLTEVQVHRFPKSICTDCGRAIGQQKAGWEETLSGAPREIYEFWKRQLQPRGYRLRVQLVDSPNGMSDDVEMTLKWG